MLNEQRTSYSSIHKAPLLTFSTDDTATHLPTAMQFAYFTPKIENEYRPSSAPVTFERLQQVSSRCQQRPYSSPGSFPFSDWNSEWRSPLPCSPREVKDLSALEVQDITTATSAFVGADFGVWGDCQLGNWLLSTDSDILERELSASGVADPIQDSVCLPQSSPIVHSPLIYTSCLHKELSMVTVPRPHRKRPRSAICSHTDPLLSGDSRPFSAPKRLYNDGCDSVQDLFANKTTVSFVPSSSATLVDEQGTCDQLDPPKSTLEALVASTSPMLFFSTDFTTGTNCIVSPLCDLVVASSAKNRTSMLDTYDTTDSNFNLDLESTCTDVESDLLNLNSAVNSISSSKSLASVDLGDANAKCPDSQNVISPTSNLSELGVSSETLSNGCASITTQLSSFVEAMRSYAAELCPVDCVILLERCRPFNCDTLFMKYFREQYLCPILSNLNGGPPLNADFGRDAYTSLYSLHGFYWRRPFPATTWVPDTPIIYRILKRIATIQHEERHASDQTDLLKGTSGCRLLESAVQAFDAIDKARRGLCKQVQRHLLLLAVSPINLNDLHVDSMKSIDDDDSLSEPLTNLRKRGVALSVFSPVRSLSLLKLYELVNGSPPSLFYDRRWQTVALSAQLLNSDSPERRVVGPLAADSQAQAEAELMLMEQQQQQQIRQQQKHQHHLLSNESPNGHYDPREPRHTNSPIPSAGFDSLLPRSDPLTICYSTGSVSDQPTMNASTNSSGTPTESIYRSAGMNVVNTNGGANSPSPVLQHYQGSTTESPVSQNARNSRTFGHTQVSTPTGYSSRLAGHRMTADGTRPSDQSAQHIMVSVNSVSAGHSGPNSVDQFGPGSVYGSDSVATPQGCSAGIMSPQQGYLTNASMTQLHSPASVAAPLGTVNMLHATTPVAPNTGSTGMYPTYIPQQQHTVFDGSASLSSIRPVQTAPLSPNTSQIPFRPPSSNVTAAAASPGGHFVNYPNSTGMPSPSAQRNNTSRQYSPQLSTQLQGTHQRRTSPHPALSQSVRAHHSSPMDNVGVSTSRSRSITPTNFAPTTNAVPACNPYASKENHCNNVITSTGSWSTTGAVSSHFAGPGNPPCSPYDVQSCRQSGGTTSEYISPDQSMSGGCRPCTLGFTGPVLNGPVTMHREVVNPVMKMNEPSSRRIDTVSQASSRRQQSSPMEQLSISRSLLWEGEAQLIDSNTAAPTSSFFGLRLLLEQTGTRDLNQLNMQLWGRSAQLSIILAPRESTLVSQLTSPVSGGYLLAWVLVELPQPDDACRLTAALSNSISPTALPLGILSPNFNAIPNPIPPGTIAFVCLSYSPKRNRIYGLIPSDSEQFRNDLPPRHSMKPLSSEMHCTGGAMQRTYTQQSVSVACARPHVVASHDDMSMHRTVIPPNPSQPSFIQQDPFLCYSGVQRTPTLLNVGGDPTNRLPPHYSSTPPNRSYATSQQSIHCHSNTPMSQTMTACNMPGTVAPMKHQPTQACSLPTTLRNTPSPLIQDGRHAPMMPDAQPPPQWIASQGDFSLHSSQPLPPRGLKNVHAQQQQQLSQQYSSTPTPQMINNGGQSHAFHSQMRTTGERFAGAGVGSAPYIVSQPLVMNEVLTTVDRTGQSGSPQFCVSTTHPTHSRFVSSGNNVYQTVPTNNPPMSYGLTAIGTQGPSSVSSGYSMLQPQASVQRVVYPNQAGPHHLLSSGGTSMAYPPSTGDGCYHPRGLPSTSMPGASNYRFECDSSPGAGGLMTNPQPHSRSTAVPMSKPHPLAQHHHSSVDGSNFQVLPNHMVNCGLMPGDVVNMGNAPQSMSASVGCSNYVSTCHDLQQQQQQHQQPPHMPNDPIMYSSVRLQHSNYDGIGSSGPPRFY